MLRFLIIIGVIAFCFSGRVSAQLDASDMAADLEEALSFNKYPTYQQYDSMMQYFASTYPELCRLDTFGTSANGRLLLALKISKNPAVHDPEPRFLYTSTMHGDELIGYNLTLRLISFLLTEYGTDTEVTRLLDNLQVWINPLANPDATYYSGDHTVAGSVRAIGADLNRSFPDISAGEADDISGRPVENQWMMLFLRKHLFNMSANLHSGAEVVNYPWDYTHTLHPDTDWFVLISSEYVDEAHAVEPTYMDDLVDDDVSGITGIINGADWYVVKGSRQDYIIHYLHGREVTLELNNPPKQVPSEQLENYWQYNKWALFNYMSQATYGIHGNVTCSATGEPLLAEIRIQNHDDNSSWVVTDSLHGRFYRYLKEGEYDIAVSAAGFRTEVIEGVSVFDYDTTLLEVRLDSSGTGIESAILPSLSLYPNPAGDYVFIEMLPAESTPDAPVELVQVISADGRVVDPVDISFSQRNIRINLSNVSPGIYFIGIHLHEDIQWMKLVRE